MMTADDWLKLRDAFHNAERAFKVQQDLMPGYEPHATAKYIFMGLAQIAGRMAAEVGKPYEESL